MFQFLSFLFLISIRFTMFLVFCITSSFHQAGLLFVHLCGWVVIIS